MSPSIYNFTVRLAVQTGTAIGTAIGIDLYQDEDCGFEVAFRDQLRAQGLTRGPKANYTKEALLS